MNKINIELIEDFLSSTDVYTLLVNNVSDEIGCFYKTVIEHLSIKFNVKLDKSEYSKLVNISKDLFETKKIYIYYITNSKQIEDIGKKNYPKIIFTDYKNYKKFTKKYFTINGYDFVKDINFFLKKYVSVNDKELINYCISQPHLTLSETSKYKINSERYKADSIIVNEYNSTLQIRKDIFKFKNSQVDLEKLFFKLKDEAKYKKFNFLTY